MVYQNLQQILAHGQTLTCGQLEIEYFAKSKLFIWTLTLKSVYRVSQKNHYLGISQLKI